MKILFYEDPLTDYRSLLWRAPHIGCDAPWLQALRDAGCDARMLLGTQLAHVARRAEVPAEALILVDEHTILAALDDPHLDINYLFQRYHGREHADASPRHSQAARHERAVGLIVAQALQSFVPDVIFTWVPAPHLRALFADALILHKETGLTSRVPFAPTYYLDPLGFHDRSALASATSLSASAPARDAFPSYKAALKRSLDTSFDAEAVASQLAGFSRTLLVASQVSGTFFFDAACDYRSQGHLLLDVIDAAPAGTAIIVSQHADRPWLGAQEATMLGDHANVIDARMLGNIGGQQLLPHVDALATVSSSVGLQSTLWDRPLLALGHSHLNGLTSFCGAEAIGAALEAEIDGADKAAWLAFHYSYLARWVSRPGWLASHLQERLEHWREHGAAGYFERAWADPDEITEFTLDQMEQLDGMPRRGSNLHYGINEAAMFAGQWTAPIHGPVPHRWLLGTEGSIWLPLDQGCDYGIDFTTAPMTGVVGQWLSLSVGSRQIAAVSLAADGATAVSAIVPAACIERPMTELRLRTIRADHAPGHERPLSIVLDRVGIRKLAAPHIRRRAAPRHSILLPVLNGESLLRETIPALLTFGGDDIELVVSDNCSDDGSSDFLHSIADDRIVRLRTEARVDYATNAENAYRHARGDWLSHIGDDDLVTPSRLAVLDQIAADPEVELILGNRLRYYWPSFGGDLANSVDPVMLGHEAVLLAGEDAARRLINSSNIRHTGATVVRRSLVGKVRRLMAGGRYMVPRVGEYATTRIAAGLAAKVAFVNRPIVAIGRHTKCIGTSLFHDPAAGQAYGVDLEREIGFSHGGSSYNYLGFQAFSYEGALLASSMLEKGGGTFPVDHRVWQARLWAELDGLIAQGRLAPEVAAAVRSRGDEAIAPAVLAQGAATLASGTPQAIEAATWGLSKRLYGSAVGVESIAQLVGWFEATHADQLQRPIRLRAVEHGPVAWIDM